jgi:hypothetical protein
MFKLKRTFKDPSGLEAGQRGFPMPGSGAQRNDTRPLTPPVASNQVRSSSKPTKGKRTWSDPGDTQRGFPDPFNDAQRRPYNPVGAQVPDGLNHEVWTPYYDRGAAAYVQNYGKVLTNPIGAGVATTHRPQASYGPAAQYVNGAIWWTSQGIPTSVNLQGLTDPSVLEAVLGPINVLAAVRVG